MPTQAPSQRLFSHRLDRAAVSVYFLGAIVPLVCLGVVVDRFALPHIDDRSVEVALALTLVFASLLSLGSFLILQRMTRAALARMDRDNQRLAALLHSSSTLGSAPHVTEALGVACKQALDLAGAEAAYVFLKGDESDAPALSGHAGKGAESAYSKHARTLDALVSLAVESRRPATRAPQAGGPAVTAVPLPTESGGSGAVVAMRDGAAFEPEEMDALATLAGLAGVALHNADLRDAQRNFFSHVTDMLVTALDSHLGYNHGHGQRVAQLANRMGRAMGLDEDALQRLHFASLLHDIGMLKLDRNQQSSAASQKHCVLGYRMLGRIRLWKDIAPIVYQHHEWFDGSGYPEGRAGQDIPVEARVIALCDAVDSMTAATSYKEPLGVEETLAELGRCAGTQFDPQLVETFTRLAREGHVDLSPDA